MSPLEQFNILPFFFYPTSTDTGLISFLLKFTQITSTEFLSAFWIICTLFILFLYGAKTNTRMISTRYTTIFELFYNTALELTFVNIGKQGLIFFPMIFSLFMFILTTNLIGLIPYSFTITSHSIITFGIALIIFIAFTILGFQTHKKKFFGLLLPSGASLELVPLLVPIEFVSYIFRVFSLPIRLFANMMAGHTLLKVIVGFAWIMCNSWVGGLFSLIPLSLLILLIGLELAVAIIQSYVFTILTCMYINDALNLH